MRFMPAPNSRKAAIVQQSPRAGNCRRFRYNAALFTMAAILPMAHALTLRTISLFFALFLLAGCGQKGPLRLPDEPAANSAENTQEQAR